ncbi:MAG: hypothetical protein M3198_09925, partial [Actinomycetota bacterium]|nr:hypothetical protein [Actinomycetota bacterium]
IDNRVGFITHYVSPIDEDLDGVKLLEQTNVAAKEILASADPLSGQLAKVQTAAQGINVNVTEILTTAGAINETAKAINPTVRSIHGTVLAINDNVTSIHSDISQTERRAHPTLAVVRDIERQVAGINQRADIIIGVVRAIKADTAGILAQTGSGAGDHRAPDGGANIAGHANSIECALPVQVAGIVTGGGKTCGQ